MIVLPARHGEIDYPLVMTNIAIENGHRNSGFSLIKNGGSFHSYITNYQRVLYMTNPSQADLRAKT